MHKTLLYLTVVLLAFGCGQKASEKSQETDCIALDENKIFCDTTWFLPYVDADTRDTLREVFEAWKFRLDDECEITLTLYKDNTYRDYSPCEWDFPFTGFYQYVCDTLYCVRIDIDNHSVSHHNPPRVICFEKYLKQNGRLKYISRKRHIAADQFDIQPAPNEMIFEKVD